MSTLQRNFFLLITSLLCFSFFVYQLSTFYHDDAYIILKYARNLLDGNGPVWNPGERVEGYSSFLWLMLLSLLGYVKVDLVLASKLLGVVFAVLTILLFIFMDRKHIPAGGLLLSTNSCFALWSLGGLEAVAFGFFIFSGVTLFSKKHDDIVALFFTGIIFSLATMTRPEGLLLLAITVVFTCIQSETPFPVKLWHCFILAAGFLLLYAPYAVWRISYYGYPFPCPFYVKGGTGILKLLFGSRYLFHFAVQYGFPLLVLLLVQKKKSFIQRNAYCVCILLCYGIYIIMIGGDHMPGFRFFVPLLPIYYLFVQKAISELQIERSRALAVFCIVITALINMFVSWRWIPRDQQGAINATSHSYQYRYCMRVPDDAAFIGAIIGKYIRANWPATAVVALNTAGSIPYYSERVCIDMLGLNDYTIARRHMPVDVDAVIREEIKSRGIIGLLFSLQKRKAFVHSITQRFFPWQLMPGHGKGYGKYVLERKPDYIILGPAYGSDSKWFFSDEELLASPLFHEQYHLREAKIPVRDSYYQYYRAAREGVVLFKYYERCPKSP